MFADTKNIYSSLYRFELLFKSFNADHNGLWDFYSHLINGTKYLKFLNVCYWNQFPFKTTNDYELSMSEPVIEVSTILKMYVKCI